MRSLRVSPLQVFLVIPCISIARRHRYSSALYTAICGDDNHVDVVTRQAPGNNNMELLEGMLMQAKAGHEGLLPLSQKKIMV